MMTVVTCLNFLAAFVMGLITWHSYRKAWTVPYKDLAVLNLVVGTWCLLMGIWNLVEGLAHLHGGVVQR